jgi:uncharacterized protein
MIVEDMRGLVLEACGDPANVLSPGFFHDHVLVVAAYAAALAPRLGADTEVVELASYLHDLSAVRDFSTLSHHAATSAALARTLLQERGYPAERATAVGTAIERHSRPIATGEGTPEEVCLANADAMAQIAMPAFWLFFAFHVLKLGYTEGKGWYVDKVRQNWDALIPEAREMLGGRYAQVAAVLETVRP